jgi:hypothetical protein
MGTVARRGITDMVPEKISHQMEIDQNVADNQSFPERK